MPEHTSEPLDFPDLARPAAEATLPPPFEEIVVRARRHRRRTVVAASAAAAAVVGVVAVGAGLATGDERGVPQPVGPSPSATAPAPSPTRDAAARAEQIVHDGRLVSYAVNAHRSLLTVWQHCTEGGRCGTAWQLQSHAGVNRGVVQGNFAATTAVGDFLVVTSWNRPGVVIDDDGRSRPLRAVASGQVAAGQGVVRVGRQLGVVDPVAATFWPLPLPTDADGWVDGTMSDAVVWAIAGRPAQSVDVRVSWLPPGGSSTDWREHTLSSTTADGVIPASLAVAHDHVAVISLHDGVDVRTYGRFSVTTDGGASWTDLRPADLPFDNVDAMAATSGGTLYLASMDSSGHDRLFRSTDSSWTSFSEVRDAPEVTQLVPAGDRVIARGGTLDRAEIYRLDDGGQVTHWASLR